MTNVRWILDKIVSITAIGLSLWHLSIVAGFGSYSTMDIRSIHLTVMLFLVFLAVKTPIQTDGADDAPIKSSGNLINLGLPIVLALLSLGAGVYTYLRWKPIAFSIHSFGLNPPSSDGNASAQMKEE
jgi:TRAP-type uncharacterized transport system fused permease subunit